VTEKASSSVRDFCGIGLRTVMDCGGFLQRATRLSDCNDCTDTLVAGISNP
jgi:hypothetical protein